MTNIKTIVQDILHILLTFSLAGMALESRLQPLISPNVYNWIVFGLLAGSVLVYFADMIFGFSNTNVPTPPTQPVATPITTSVI